MRLWMSLRKNCTSASTMVMSGRTSKILNCSGCRGLLSTAPCVIFPRRIKNETRQYLPFFSAALILTAAPAFRGGQTFLWGASFGVGQRHHRKPRYSAGTTPSAYEMRSTALSYFYMAGKKHGIAVDVARRGGSKGIAIGYRFFVYHRLESAGESLTPYFQYGVGTCAPGADSP